MADGRSPPSPPRRKIGGYLALGAAIAGILVGASVVSRRMFEGSARPPRPTGPPTAPPRLPLIEPAPANLPFRVASTEGKVEAFRDARWVPVKPGDVLTIQDVVRTAPGARAVLRRGASTELELRERVDVRLDRFTSDAASLDVLRGKVVANVARAGESLQITARETRSSNQGVARFVVSVDDKGRVAVASTKGATRFTAQGKEVRLAEGTESHAEPGGPPAEPEKIPEQVLLSVVWPAGERKEDRAQIRGQAAPSSTVKVNGVDAEVGPRGDFAAVVPLRRGANRIEVETEDPAGRTKAVSNVVKRGSKAPGLEAEPEDLWQR